MVSLPDKLKIEAGLSTAEDWMTYFGKELFGQLLHSILGSVPFLDLPIFTVAGDRRIVDFCHDTYPSILRPERVEQLTNGRFIPFHVIFTNTQGILWLLDDRVQQSEGDILHIVMRLTFLSEAEECLVKLFELFEVVKLERGISNKGDVVEDC